MIFQYSPFVPIILLSGIISVVLACVGWRNRKNPLSRPFTLVMVAETIWIFGYAIEISSPTLQMVLLVNNIEYLGLVTVPVGFLFVVLYYTGREYLLTKKTVPLFFIVPALVCLIVITNPLHHLYYTGFQAVLVSGSVVWIYDHGPLFWLALSYFYVVSFAAFILMAGHLVSANDLYRRQTIILTAAAAIPVACNMGYIFKIAPFPEFDLTPIAFVLTGVIMAIGLLRYQLFVAMPVAYSRLFAIMKDGVIATDGQFRVIDTNPATEEITGIPTPLTIGKKLNDLIPITDPEFTGENRLSSDRQIEVSLPRDGVSRYYDVLVTPMKAGMHNTEGYLFLFRDITRRKQDELAIAEAHKKISLLSSITRHDLNNKLQAVHTYLELVRMSAVDPEQQKYLNDQEAAVLAMRDQIAFTRDYEQLGSEAPVWQDLEKTVEAARKQSGTTTSVTFNGENIEVSADPMFEKVFYNLIDNAVRYGGPAMTCISVSTCPAESGRVIIVEDNGTGISPDVKARLFERGCGRHTGLGLFLSREILAMTGITITETGEYGHGARFELTVPFGKFRK
ncbi:MAG: histidine kinase N-terminal 7TM domain-containing protein [Methanoregula sp.]